MFKQSDLEPKRAIRSGSFIIVNKYKKNGVNFYQLKAVRNLNVWVKISEVSNMCVKIDKGEVVATQERVVKKSRFDDYMIWLHKKSMKYKDVVYKPIWR